MATLKFTGNLTRMTVTLASAYTAGSGTMTLTSGHGARLPTTGDFWLVPTSGTYQSFKVTARSTDTLTVVGSQDGTTDASLSTGAELEWNLTASALTQLIVDTRHPNRIAPPVASAFTATNTGSSTITDIIDGLEIAWQVGGSVERFYEIAAPGATMTLSAKLYGHSNASGGRTGIFVRSSVTSKVFYLGYRRDAVSGYIAAERWSYAGTWNSQVLYSTPVQFSNFYKEWLRIQVTATHIICSWSQDGLGWVVMYSELISAWLAGDPTTCGLFNYSNDGSYNKLTVNSFSATTP